MREEHFFASLAQIARLCGLAGRHDISFRDFVLSMMGILAPMMEEARDTLQAAQIPASRDPLQASLSDLTLTGHLGGMPVYTSPSMPRDTALCMPRSENPYIIRRDRSHSFYCSECGQTLESSYAICHQCHDRTAGESTGGGVMSTQPLADAYGQSRYGYLGGMPRGSGVYDIGVDVALPTPNQSLSEGTYTVYAPEGTYTANVGLDNARARRYQGQRVEQQVAPEEVSFARTECGACHEPLFYAKEKRSTLPVGNNQSGYTQVMMKCDCGGYIKIQREALEATVYIDRASKVLETYGSGTDCDKVTCQECGDIWIMPSSLDYILCDKLHLTKDEATGKVSTTRCDTVIQRDRADG